MTTANSKQLLIVGASVRAAAQSAVRAGFRVWGADLFADADLCALADASAVTRYPTELLASIARAPHAPWIYTGALENYPTLLRRMGHLRPLWGNTAEVVRRVRNPILLSQTLPPLGISFPRTIEVDAGQRDKHFQPDHWIVKSQRSGGGDLVGWLDDGRQLEQRGRWYLQQFVSGAPCSAIYVAAGGRAVLLGVTRQLIGTPWLHATGFRYGGSIGPIPLLEQRAELQHIGNVLAEEFSLVGLFGVDLVQQFGGAGEFSVIEINPRYTASIEVLERSRGYSAMAWHVAACTTGKLPDFAPSRSVDRFLAKGILFAKGDAVFHPEVVDYVRQLNTRPLAPAIADVPHLNSPITCGQPIVTLFAEGSCEADAETNLRQAVTDFEQILYAR